MGYKEERERLINKAESLLNENKLEEANNIMEQIKALDVERANDNALNNNLTRVHKDFINLNKNNSISFDGGEKMKKEETKE